MNNRKRIFFTADTHFFHANAIKFDNRPFTDVEHMHRVLINNYNACVPEDGICYFLGDVGFNNNAELKKLLSKLNGTKVLILGNHDKNTNAMYNIGFDAVMHSATLFIAGEKVTLSHYPLLGVKREDTAGMRNSTEGENWHREASHRKFALEDIGQFHLAGHLHAPNGGKSKVKQGRQWDIGVPGNNYTPVSISKVESWIGRTKNEEKAKLKELNSILEIADGHYLLWDYYSIKGTELESAIHKTKYLYDLLDVENEGVTEEEYKLVERIRKVL